MSDPVFKKIEITGCSNKGVDAAIQNAIAKASETVRQLRWFEVTEIRGTVEDDEVSQWQVTVKIGFKLED